MRRRLKSRWVTGGVIVVVLGAGTAAGVMAGTAGASSRPAVVQHVTDSPVTTTDLSFTVSVTGLTATPVTITGSGAVDFTNDAASLTVDLPAVVAKLIPGGSDSPEVVNAVLSGGTVYLEIPSLAPLVGEPWISVALPTAATSALPGIFTKAASALGDVNAIVQWAQAHHATVTSLGTSMVDGVEATGTQIVATLGATTTRTLTASVWADSSDRLVQSTLSVTGTGKKGPVGVTATVNASGDGDPVTITVPPSSQVKPIAYATVARYLGRFLHRTRLGPRLGTGLGAAVG